MTDELANFAGNMANQKLYSFDNHHNPLLPAEYWFQHPVEGLTLFLVLYTQACRWARCLGCNLPSKMSEKPVDFRALMKQIDFTFDYIVDKTTSGELRKIILSNNGSVLDEITFSTTALLYFVAKMNIHCSHIGVLSLETRPEYVDLEELTVLKRALDEGDCRTNLELAIGFEAYSDVVRNDYFHKGFSKKVFEKMVENIAQYQYKLKTYFMLKPVPFMSEEAAITDLVEGIDYLDSVSRECQIDINMHINPTYVARGTPLEVAFRKGDFTPPTLESLRKVILHGEGKKISIFAGLSDEDLAVPGGGFIREGDEELREVIEDFNRTQDYNLLKTR